MFNSHALQLRAHTGAQVWLYHSHTDEVADTYAGLVGAMVITRRGMATSAGKPSDVDTEVFTFFQVNDENSRCVACPTPALYINVEMETGCLQSSCCQLDNLRHG